MEATVGTELTHMVGARVGEDTSLLRRGGRRRLGREGKRTASTGRSGGSGSSSSGGGTFVLRLLSLKHCLRLRLRLLRAC